MVEIMPLSIDQYHRMIDAGILENGTPVELLEGYLIGKDRGLGQERPQPCRMLADPPRLAGLMEVWPLSIEQYERMNAMGIFDEDDPIELLDGYLVAIDRGRGPGMPPGPKHALGTDRVHRHLTRTLPEPWLIRGQNPIRLGPPTVAGAGSEPQPDVSVVRGPESLYEQRFPGPEDLRLVVEVADSSLPTDRSIKGERYAAANIPLYWIVNLVDRQLEVYSDPDPAVGRYRSQQMLSENEQVVLSWEGLAPVTFQVRDFLP
jgi:Uma2 family endonuclease